MIRSLLPLLVLVVLALLSTLYLSRLEADLRPDTSARQRAPKMVGEGLRYRTTDDSGQAAYRLDSILATEGPGEAGTDLVAPRLVSYTNGTPSVTGRSDDGWLSADRNLLLLMNAVRIDQLPIAGRTAARLSTEYLEIYPQTREARTNREVHLTSPGHVVDAVGMRADLEANTVELLSRVRGRHDLNPR